MMKCGRCGGLMVPHQYTDVLETTSADYCDGFRCVNCGEILDAVVLAHREQAQTSGFKTGRPWSRKVAA